MRPDTLPAAYRSVGLGPHRPNTVELARPGVVIRVNVTPSVERRIVDCAPAMKTVPSENTCVHHSVPVEPVETRVQLAPS